MTDNAKICPKCSQAFQSGNITICPVDGSILQEIGFVLNLNTTVANKYLLLEELESDSWGTAYLCRHKELNMKVSVKFLSYELSNDTRHINLFKQESQVLTGLEHPSIARVLDFGLIPRPFIVTEYVQGQLLSGLLSENGPLSVAQVHALGLQLFVAMNYAHSLGLVHGNLTPQKIMVCQPEELLSSGIKLLDCGFSRLLNQEAIWESTGEAFGSPPYMSPEQFSREYETGAKADIYSAGCILYECLTGHRPFSSSSYVGWSAVHRHIHPGFKTETDRSVQHEKLMEFILFCLAKNPEERPGSKKMLTALKKMDVGGRAVLDFGPLIETLRSKPALSVVVLVGFLIFIAVGSATISSNDKNKARLAAARKLSEQADTARTDLITTMSGGQILQQVEAESSLLTLSKGPAPLNLEIYKPGSVQAAVIVLSAARGDAKLLDSLFNFWAQRGYLVAVVQMARNPVQAPADASLVRSTMKHLSDGGTLSKEAAGRIALVSVAMDLDETMLAAKELGQDSNNGSGELSGVILINPVAGGQPAAVAADYHACQFPVCYILDADVKPAARQSAMRRCLTAFSFGSGRQLFFNSLRISLTAKPSYNQTVLHSLLSGFLSAGLGQDHAKESYLYSQKSVTAVSSVADLRFR